MRRVALWAAIGLAGLAVVAVLGALLVDAPMPGRPSTAAPVDCGDEDAVVRAEAERERRARLGLRTASTGC